MNTRIIYVFMLLLCTSSFSIHAAHYNVQVGKLKTFTELEPHGQKWSVSNVQGPISVDDKYQFQLFTGKRKFGIKGTGKGTGNFTITLHDKTSNKVISKKHITVTVE